MFLLFLLNKCRGSVAEYVLYFKCHRIYYNESVTEYANLYIFCDTCLKWDFHYNIFKDTCVRVFFQRLLVLKYINRNFLYNKKYHPLPCKLNEKARPSPSCSPFADKSTV